MLDWNLLITEQIVTSVLPPAFKRYAPPIRGALVLFLKSLPAAEQRTVLAGQTSLPANAGAEERLAFLARTCPALHKLGQTLARDHRLSPEFRHHLQKLESLPPSVPLPAVEKLLAEELGPLASLGLTLVPPLLAEGSVAIVAAFQENRGTRRQGVFKILKPGVADRLELELAALPNVGTYLDEQCHAHDLPNFEYQETLEQVRDKLRHELRLDLEQRHLAHAAKIYRNNPDVQIPALFPHCTPRITAMERIFGQKITDPLSSCGSAQFRNAELVATALIATPVFSRDPHTIFHADPHAGNLLLTADRRLAILDWSLTGMLTEAERVALAQIALGALTLDSQRVMNAIADLTERDVFDAQALRPVVDAALQRIRQGAYPGMNWLVALFDQATQIAGLRVRADLMMFRKMLHSLEGVLTDIGVPPDAADCALAREYLARLAQEWPLRFLAVPTTRAFPTRLSNLDCYNLMLTLPWSATQVLMERTLNPPTRL